MKKNILLVALILFGIIGCKKFEGEGYGSYTETFLQGYTYLGSIECEQDALYNPLTLKVKYESSGSVRYSKISEQPDTKFAELSRYFGDDHFNRKKAPPPDIAFADEFTAIDIVSDQNFDTEHPAGTSLTNITKVETTSFYRFIQQGYADRQMMAVTVMVSELTQDNLKLIKAPNTDTKEFAWLTFAVTPPPGEHNITITLRTAEEEFSATCTAVFE